MNKLLNVGEEYQRIVSTQPLQELSLRDFKEILAVVTSIDVRQITSADTLRLDDQQIDSYQAILAKLETSYPLEYITGKTQFYGYELTIKPNVLIPRPETEQLVDLAKNMCIGLQSKLSILEIGTGSGCIATALALELNKLSVHYNYTAIDISPAALENTSINLADFHLVNKISTHLASLRGFIDSSSDKQFDLVISNPPYLTAKQMNELAASVRYEPSQALSGGEDGLKYYREILELSTSIRNTTGKLPALALEADPEIMSVLSGLIGQIYSRDRIYIVQDLFGQERFIIAQ